MSLDHIGVSDGSKSGVAAVCAAMALFAGNDALIKLLSQSLPAAQVMLLRGLVGGALLLGLVLVMGSGPRLAVAFRPAVLLRAVLDALASVMFVMALMGLPVATITALIQLVPIVTASCGVLLFGDRITVRQVGALALGLAGVLVVTRPFSAGIGVHLLFGLAAMLLLSARDVVTRYTAPQIPSLIVATTATFAVPLLSIPDVVASGWQPLDTEAALLIGLISLLVAAGNVLMVVAVRHSPFPAIAPYRYTAIPFAALAGLLLLGEWPDTAMIIGAAAIAASGILALPAARTRLS